MTLRRSRASVAALASAVGLMTLLSGCFEKTIDESVVFNPRVVERKATDASEMYLDNEANLLRPTPEMLIEARGFASHLPASIIHGLWGEGEERIAWTMVNSVSTAESDVKRPLVVNCFGNGSDRIADGVWSASKSFAWGDVLLFDYPGYGDSGGIPSDKSMHKMQTLLSDKVNELGADRPIILWGHSLGGFVCSSLAGVTKEVDAVVLEATALNVEEVAAAWKPWYLPFIGMDIKDSLKDYDNARSLGHFGGPIIVLGAEKDEMLPVGLARSLRKALKRRNLNVSYLEFSKAEHSTITDQYDFQNRLNPLLSDIKDLKD